MSPMMLTVFLGSSESGDCRENEAHQRGEFVDLIINANKNALQVGLPLLGRAAVSCSRVRVCKVGALGICYTVVKSACQSTNQIHSVRGAPPARQGNAPFGSHARVELREILPLEFDDDGVGHTIPIFLQIAQRWHATLKFRYAFEDETNHLLLCFSISSSQGFCFQVLQTKSLAWFWVCAFESRDD